MSEFAFVTTCKGRLHHLQQTLPLMVADVPDEIVVVDYGCPQRSGDWVEANFPQVTVVRVTDDDGFRLARARNLGAAACSAPWICFIDADIRIRPGFVAWMRDNVRERRFYRQAPIDGKRHPEAYGTVLCPRPAFARLGGYDEVITGWGGEDNDLYDRLNETGLSPRDYPSELIDPISHDDDQRVTFHRIKDLKLQQAINGFYRKAKLQVMRFHGTRGDLPLATRRKIRAAVESSVKAWDWNPERPAPRITLNLDNSAWMPPGYRLRAKSRLTLSMEFPQEPGDEP